MHSHFVNTVMRRSISLLQTPYRTPVWDCSMDSNNKRPHFLLSRVEALQLSVDRAPLSRRNPHWPCRDGKTLGANVSVASTVRYFTTDWYVATKLDDITHSKFWDSSLSHPSSSRHNLSFSQSAWNHRTLLLLFRRMFRTLTLKALNTCHFPICGPYNSKWRLLHRY